MAADNITLRKLTLSVIRSSFRDTISDVYQYILIINRYVTKYSSIHNYFGSISVTPFARQWETGRHALTRHQQD